MSSEKDYLKIPKFSGKTEDWQRWSDLFTSVLEQKELAPLLDHLSDRTETPKDDDDCTGPGGTGPVHLKNGF